MCVSAAVSGRSSVLDVNSLFTGLHLLLTSLRVTSWWEHVDTHANPADGGSRQGTSCKLAKRLENPTGVGKVSLCAGLHGGRWSHRVVEVFQDLCMSTITSVCRQNVWSSDLLCSLGQRPSVC